jgi:hypothetical protein
MEPREAIDILLKMRDKYPLDPKEQEAVLAAIGTLDSAAFTKNRIKGIIKKRKDKHKV